MIRRTIALTICLVLAAIGSISCGGGGADTPEAAPPTPGPTQAVAPAAPGATATTPPDVATATPAAQPTEEATETPLPMAQVILEWDPNGVRPSDSDDVDAIVLDLQREQEGIISGYGNEQSITIQYDPTAITVDELMDILDTMGHPVVKTQ
jgi:hypothetical protein